MRAPVCGRCGRVVAGGSRFTWVHVQDYYGHVWGSPSPDGPGFLCDLCGDALAAFLAEGPRPGLGVIPTKAVADLSAARTRSAR